METNYPDLSNEELLQRINDQYGVRAQALWLHRDSGGRVYYLQCPEGRKVFKLYRPVHTGAAVQSTQILAYLERNGFPVVRMLPTLDGCSYMTLEHESGESVGILFEFAKGKCIGFLHRWRNGTQPPIHPKAKLIGQSVGRMHRLMEDYGGPLAPKGRARYIDDLLDLIRRDAPDAPSCLRDLEVYGNELWALAERTPQGFCHGDMHTGNTVYRGGLFTWMDFDRVARSHPVLDVSWLTDGTDFNVFDEGALDRSLRLFEAVHAGYEKERHLSDEELAAVFPCVAVVHYDLIASIVLQSGQRLRLALLEEQRQWLMNWRELCLKKGV